MSGGKTKPEDIFPSIKQLKDAELEAEKTLKSFKRSPFYSHMQASYKDVGKDI